MRNWKMKCAIGSLRFWPFSNSTLRRCDDVGFWLFIICCNVFGCFLLLLLLLLAVGRVQWMANWLSRWKICTYIKTKVKDLCTTVRKTLKNEFTRLQLKYYTVAVVVAECSCSCYCCYFRRAHCPLSLGSRQKVSQDDDVLCGLAAKIGETTATEWQRERQRDRRGRGCSLRQRLRLS